MKAQLIFFLLIMLTASVPNSEIITSTSDYQRISDSEVIIDNDIFLESGSIIYQNVKVILDSSDEFNFTLSGNASLILINSSIVSDSPFSIRLSGNATAEIVNSTVFNEFFTHNASYIGSGFGLSENASLYASCSKIGFVRQMEEAESILEFCEVGELGTRSSGTLMVKYSTIRKLSLYYENAVININQILNGKFITLNNTLLANHSYSRPFLFIDTIILNPPDLYLENSIVKMSDAKVGNVLALDGSIVDCYNSSIKQLYFESSGWLTAIRSNLKSLLCYNGDFNFEIKDSKIGMLVSYMSIGLNLKVEQSNVSFLNLMYAHTDTPHNIEFVRSNITSLYLKPGGPIFYQFSDTMIRELVLEPDSYNYTPPILTGSLSFSDNFTINYVPGEGSSVIYRVFKIVFLENGAPVSGIPIKISRNNQTLLNESTNQNGEVIVRLAFIRRLETIKDPNPGGPYLISDNTFQVPLVIEYMNHKKILYFNSSAPIIFDTDLDDVLMNDDKYMIPLSQIYYGVILSIILIILYNKMKIIMINNRLD